MAREEQLPARLAALGFHARFLAGTAAYRREEWTEAVKHFRFALNAVNYLAAAPEGGMPEPLRSAVVALTRNRLAAADARDGRRGLWLSTLDRLGLGFDS